MVFAKFYGYVQKFKVTNYVGLADSADRLNFLFTTAILLTCSTIISVKQYMFKAIACFLPNHPSGKNFKDYLQNYCWIHGTIPLHSDESTPQDHEWMELEKTRSINYYQWIPMVLGLQVILYTLPNILWQTICFHYSRSDLNSLMTIASKAKHSPITKRSKPLQHCSAMLIDMLDLTHNPWRYSFQASCMMRFQGNILVLAYLCIKLLSLGNTVGQLFMMQSFLGFRNSSSRDFGWQLLRDISQGRNWEDSLMFPRVSHCVVKDVRIVGSSKQAYVAPCSLPVNMLNEKVYIFLWFWTLFLCCVTAGSVLVWISRLCWNARRERFVLRILRLSTADCQLAGSTGDKSMALIHFVQDFLQLDGVFLIHMILTNGGDSVTREIVTTLWQHYNEQLSRPKAMQVQYDGGNVASDLSRSDTTEEQATFV